MRVFEEDVWVSKSLRLLGEYSPGELRLLQRLVRPEDVVVEAGAYLGDLTVPLSRCCKQIHAFEPQEEVRELLLHNLRVNGCTNVTVYPYALGHAHAKGYYKENEPGSPGSTMIVDNVEDKSADVVPLDDVSLSHVDLIKGDVEGMEVLLLAGAQNTIWRHRPTLFMECDTVATPGQISLGEAYTKLQYDYNRMQFFLYERANWKGAENPFGLTGSFMALGTPMEVRGQFTP
jgi:FkbM family methyltransferase